MNSPLDSHKTPLPETPLKHKRLPRSVRKYIRRHKAMIRTKFKLPDEQQRALGELEARFKGN